MLHASQSKSLDSLHRLPRSRAAFTGALNGKKNPQFLAINHGEVPCTVELLNKGGKATPIRFTILRPLSAGFATAPFKLKDHKRDPDAKVLSELVYGRGEGGESVPSMMMWTYPRVGKSDRGPRSDTSWMLQPGNTMVLWLDEERLTQKDVSEPILPAGIASIPAFTVCVICLQGKADSSVAGGSAVKIVSVRPADFSLHSLGSDLRLLATDAGGARAREMEYRERFPGLAKDLDVKDVPYWAPVNRGAVVDTDGADGCIRLVNWGDAAAPQVDISHESLLRYTNSTRVDWACALLDAAIASGALNLLVFSSDFFKGCGGCGFRAVPVIDAGTLLGAIAPQNAVAGPQGGNEEEVAFDTGARVDVEGKGHFIRMRVACGAPTPVPVGSPPPCEDFVVCGLHTELEAAHFVEIGLVDPETREETRGMWKGYLNASPPKAAAALGGGVKRKAWTPMAE